MDMGRLPNDGRGRLGGRAKGTKNRELAPLDEWAEDIINRRRGQFLDDLDKLTPQERAPILGGLFAALIANPDTHASTYKLARTTREALRKWPARGQDD